MFNGISFDNNVYCAINVVVFIRPRFLPFFSIQAGQNFVETKSSL